MLWLIWVSYYIFMLSCIDAVMIDPMVHEVQLTNEKTFTMKVKVARQNLSVAAFFYTPKDRNIKDIINNHLDVAAKELKGIFPIVVVDCSDDTMKSHCNSELGKDYTTPVLKVYPKLPMPALNYTGKLLKDDIKRTLVNYVPSNVVIIDKVHEFLAQYETLHKVLLFSNKSTPSYLYKALSNAFDKKLLLGYVDVNKYPDLKKQYGVKNVPHLMIIKPNSTRDVFNDKFEYDKMFDWLNVYAETFVLGSGAKDSQAKPWKFDPLPQLTYDSHIDLCFNNNQNYCVVYLVDGELNTNDKTMLLELSEKFKKELNSKWVWMDVSVEVNFKKLFNLEVYPSLVIFNSKKRLRYMLHNKELPINREKIEKVIENILAGNARFTLLSTLPEFQLTYKKPSDEL